MRTSEKTTTIAAALYAVHRDLENPRKDAKGQVRGNPNYRYLSLPALIDHAKAALREAQVAVIQEVVGGVGWVEVNTRFMHLTGEWIEVGPLYLAAQGSAQEVGSAITYARRYALAAALNLAADEDDDGMGGPTRGDDGVGQAARTTGEPSHPAPTAASSASSSPAQADGASTGSSTGGRGGDAENVAGDQRGREAFGEGAVDPAPATHTTSGSIHGDRPHILKASPNVPGEKYCIIVVDGKRCDYTEGAS